MATPDLTSITRKLIEQEALPDTYADTVSRVILPLAEHIRSLHEKRQRPLVVGINGAQGTGKSTLTLFLQELLSGLYQVPTASFSIDDLYLTRAGREQLAAEWHPLMLTRGVPGTHNLTLGRQVIERLTTAAEGTRTAIPAFDKSRDDRAPDADWPVYQGRAEVVLLEGWCVGAAPEDSDSLAMPINALERSEDVDGAWRSFVNQCLRKEYAQFFEQLDWLIMLKAPSMDAVLNWRTLQERKLSAKIRNAPQQGDARRAPSRLMTEQQIVRFIMHYERITRACLAEMPARADVLIQVDENHNFSEPLIRQRY